MRQFPGVISAASGNKANAAAVATLVHTGVTLTYVTGIEVKASGATAALPVLVTLTGILGGTLTWVFTFPAGALVEAAPLVVTFNPPLQSVDVSTDIVLTLPASGSGGTNASVVLHGFVGSQRYSVSSTTQFLPSDLPSLAAWFRFNTGQAVSQWNDQSGNARHLKQANASNQPTISSGSYIFDGISQYLKCDAFTLNQPTTVYMLGKQITWNPSLPILDGNANNSGTWYQVTATPEMDIYAGAFVVFSGADVGTYHAYSSVFNGASSSTQVDNGTITTGDAGAANMGGFTLGARGDGGIWANIQVKEVVIYSVAHNAATRQQVVNYLLTL